MVPLPLSAQRMELHARAGVAVSSPLVRDAIAVATMTEAVGAPVDDEARAFPAPAPVMGGSARVFFWPDVALEAGVDWAWSELRAEDGAGARRVQGMGVLQGGFGVSWAVRPALELGAGAGFLSYRTAERGLFAGGSDVSPTLEARIGWMPSLWSRRITVLGSVQTHRFGTPALRREGGSDGAVTRLGLTARVRLAEAGR